MAKQITFYKVQFGIEDEVPINEGLKKSAREEQLLGNLHRILTDVTEAKGLKVGDVAKEFGISVVRTQKTDKIYAHAFISVRSIHHVKEAAGLFRQAFNILTARIRDGEMLYIQEPNK